MLLWVLAFQTTSQQNRLIWHAGLCSGWRTRASSVQRCGFFCRLTHFLWLTSLSTGVRPLAASTQREGAVIPRSPVTLRKEHRAAQVHGEMRMVGGAWYSNYQSGELRRLDLFFDGNRIWKRNGLPTLSVRQKTWSNNLTTENSWSSGSLS